MNLTAVLKQSSSGIRIFFVLWLGQLVSLIGTRLTAFALGYWVYQQTGSATQFMLIAVATPREHIEAIERFKTVVGVS